MRYITYINFLIAFIGGVLITTGINIKKSTIVIIGILLIFLSILSIVIKHLL